MKHAWMLAAALAWSTGHGSGPDVDTACLDCHRGAQARADVPVIEGQQRDYLAHQLQRFRERHRDSFPMTAFARGMDDAAIGEFAQALAARPWPASATKAAADAAARGRAVAARRDCAACHGEGFLGAGDVPRLAGQRAGYLARQIAGFGQGDRFHPPTGTGSPMRTVPAREARDLAAFLHALGAQ